MGDGQSRPPAYKPDWRKKHMTFIPIYRKSNYLDVHLTTTDKDIQNLIDEILDEIACIKEFTNRTKARKALEKVIVNLIHAVKTGGDIRISRDSNKYGHNKMYGKPWFKHKWLVEITEEGLTELGYVEFENGYYDRKKKRGLRSKITVTNKLLCKLKEKNILFPNNPKKIDREAPEQVIQLKDADKNFVDFTWYKPRVKMKERLEQYNAFIQEQYMTVNLPEPLITDNEFWLNNLLRGLLNGRYTLDRLKLNQEIYPMNTDVDKSYSIIHLGKEGSSNSRSILYPHNISSSQFNISTNTTLPTYISTSSILHPNINTSTLTSHILTLIHLSSTHDISSRRLSNKAIMNSNEKLLDYFLNWLYFLNTDIRRGKIDKETKRLFRVRRSLGELGMSELIFRLKYQSLHRVFNLESFKKGGRFYGGAHLDIPSHMRGFIKINGEPVIELDYDAFHVRMLYHLRGQDIIEDPYDLIEGPEDRRIKKTVLLTAINAPDDKLAVKGIRKELVDDGIKGEILTDKSIKSLLERAKSAHPEIADDIGSGKGRMLQNLDSNIADAILTSFMAENIPVLPVHDSFIVPQQFEDELRQKMMDEYEKILGFKPGVSKKKKRYQPKK